MVQMLEGETQTNQFVGREAELTRRDQCLTTALAWERQLIFVTGEPGIGKTTLVQTFIAAQGERKNVRIGYVQCIEQYGAGERIYLFWKPLIACAWHLKANALSWSSANTPQLG